MKRPRADQTTERLAAASQQSERRPGLRAAGLAASRVVAPVVAGRGGGILARLKAEWAAVVGSELAALTWPEAHSRDGALKLRVDSRFALDLQHRAPLVIDRINMFFGRASVTRLVLVQGGLPLAAPARPAPLAPLTPSERQALDAQLADVVDPELRAALSRLGELVLAGVRRGG